MILKTGIPVAGISPIDSTGWRVESGISRKDSETFHNALTCMGFLHLRREVMPMAAEAGGQVAHSSFSPFFSGAIPETYRATAWISSSVRFFAMVCMMALSLVRLRSWKAFSWAIT